MKKKDNRDILIGVLLAIIFVSMFFSFRNNITGQDVKTVDMGVLRVQTTVKDKLVNVYVDNEADEEVNWEFAFVQSYDDKPYKLLEAGNYSVKVVADGYGDKIYKNIEVKSGELTIMYSFMYKVI